MQLPKKTVLITGASGGIGSQIALTFSKAGARVILSFKNNLQAAEKLQTKIEQTGGKASLCQFDVTDEADVEAAFTKMNPAPDILINNAGAFPFGELLQMSAQDWDEVQAVNLRSAFLCSREATKTWVSQNLPGNIVNIASIAASLSQQQITHYCVAKAGLVALSRNMAAEFGPAGIRVNTVSPGLVWRESLENDWPEGIKSWQKTAPLGKLVKPEDVANACLFLASEQAVAITGIELTVDAGISVSYPF